MGGKQARCAAKPGPSDPTIPRSGDWPNEGPPPTFTDAAGPAQTHKEAVVGAAVPSVGRKTDSDALGPTRARVHTQAGSLAR